MTLTSLRRFSDGIKIVERIIIVNTLEIGQIAWSLNLCALFTTPLMR